MVFYSLRVGTFLVKYQPFNDDEESYPIVDKDKNILEYVKGSRTNGYYVNPVTKEKVEQTFILYNDELTLEFERTKETDRYKEVEESDKDDFVNPKQYIVDCDRLLNDLKASGKALKFRISFRGRKPPYKAIVFVNKTYNCLEMWITRRLKSEQLKEYGQQLADKKKVEELSLIISGITKKAKIEDLEI